MSIWLIGMAGGNIYAGIKLKRHFEAFLDPTKLLTNFIKERIEDFVEPVVKPINDTLNAVKGVVDKIPGVSQVSKGIRKIIPGLKLPFNKRGYGNDEQVEYIIVSLT